MKVFLSMLLFLTFLSSTASCAITYKYGSYYGKVVDAETKEPLEGAAVLAVFYTQEYGPAGPITRFVDAIETVTDKNGEFKLPPYRVTAFRLLQSWDPYPQFRIFKPAYGCYPEHKDVKPIFVPNGTLPADKYVTIELPRLKTREELLQNTDCFPVSVPDEKMKKLIELNNIERLRLGLQPTHIY